jgi:multidrug resistance efflux pump
MLLSALCVIPPVMAQEAAADGKPSVERLQLQLEFQMQRVKILKDRLQLMKSLQQTELDQARLQAGLQRLELEFVRANIEQSEANLELANKTYDRARALHERNAIPETEVDQARLKLGQAQAGHRKVVAEAELKKQEAAGTELQLKRLELQGAIQVNEMELEILEAEHEIQLSRLELKSRAE